ncbi:hypothetical protein DFH07DRAFT_962619 [Mycena maculata]|uniref:Uncharacterized protein n=1 Tax=Mycena maculata TaxID=230809 RepID=A0AAD7N599_9AGAR|nr:hypothetical protein DFH07DRAFT_962619 [Mycena maculata]
MEWTPQFHYSFRDCEIWSIYQAAAALAIVIAVDYILILRVFALYNNNRVIKIAVCSLFLLELSGMLIGLGFSLSGIGFDATHMCIITHFPKSFVVYGACAVLFQTCLFTLTLLKFIGTLRAGWSDVPLLVLTVRDGTWAYLLAVGDVSLYVVRNQAIGGVLYGWMITAFSFSGYRILPNLGGSLREDQNMSMKSPMRFGWERESESARSE